MTTRTKITFDAEPCRTKGEGDMDALFIETECGHRFQVAADRLPEWQEVIAGMHARGPGAQGPIFDCKVCDALLLAVAVADERLIIGCLFHQVLHEADPSWPADGRGTEVIEF